MESAQAEVERLRRLQTVGRLTASLVHDFNNALGAIVAFVDQVGDVDSEDPNARFMAQLRSSLNRGVRLLRAVSVYSLRGARGREKVDLADLADDVFMLLSTALRHGATVVNQHLERGIDVRVNRVTAMDLLLGVALHCSETADGAPEIDVRTTRIECDGRRFAAVQFELEGDAARDDLLRRLADCPDSGLDEIAVALRSEGESLVDGVLALTLAGGRLVCEHMQGRRLISICFSMARVESA